MADENPCRCLVRHPLPGAERDTVLESLRYARSVGDSRGVVVAISQLQGGCRFQKEVSDAVPHER